MRLGPSHLEMERGYEAQRQNNFEMFIYGLSQTETITLAVNAAPALMETNDPITLSYGNRDVKVAGKATYDSGTVTLKDFIEKDVAGIIQDWRDAVYNAVTDSIGFASDYKKEARIIEFAPDGTYSRIWVCKGVWPQSVNWGSHDYGAADLKTIELTLSMDRMYRDRSVDSSTAAKVGALLPSLSGAFSGL